MNMCPPTYRSSAVPGSHEVFCHANTDWPPSQGLFTLFVQFLQRFSRFEGCNCKIVDQLEMSGKESFTYRPQLPKPVH